MWKMLTKEEKQLKEAMRILIRDGQEGNLYKVAVARYRKLVSEERIKNLSFEIEGVDWTSNYASDINKIEKMIAQVTL